MTRPRSTTSQADELGAILASLKSRVQAVELLAHTPCGGGGGGSTPTGLVSPYAGVAAPTGWLLCDGTAYDQTLYPDLFAAIGSSYNNASGQASPPAGFFRVPDLRSRVPMGAGTGIGLSNRALASSSGVETRTIASTNLPTHQHTIDHDHPNTTSGTVSADHSHSGGTGGINANHTHGIGFSFIGFAAGGSVMATPNGTNPLTYPSLTVSSDHAHGFSTGGISANHTHNTDIPNFSGSSGNGGFANTAIDIMNPFLSLNYIIKV